MGRIRRGEEVVHWEPGFGEFFANQPEIERGGFGSGASSSATLYSRSITTLSSSVYKELLLRHRPSDQRNPSTQTLHHRIPPAMTISGAHLCTSNPRFFSSSLASKPSSSHFSASNSPFISNPRGCRTTQINATRLASSPSTSAIICDAPIVFSDPNEM
ncbi:hypothetical protein IEQ34_007989 [Dendrobium chrysotoxum]|uniref:Uncharacterized protein n=1 Tax=Dendrobium chrysotoxum TaxID=161865 RepID=A0AAV7H3C0_DENCH|nr:hypothetical protein IEQ34_007989 [Dendrobium chrysotoxum]